MTLTGLLGLLSSIAFVAFIVRTEIRHRRVKQSIGPVKADPRVLAVLVEQQAKIDLQSVAVRMLFATHPQKDDMAILLRAAATHLTSESARETPDTHALYESTLRNSLESLLAK